MFTVSEPLHMKCSFFISSWTNLEKKNLVLRCLTVKHIVFYIILFKLLIEALMVTVSEIFKPVSFYSAWHSSQCWSCFYSRKSFWKSFVFPRPPREPWCYQTLICLFFAVLPCSVWFLFIHGVLFAPSLSVCSL